MNDESDEDKALKHGDISISPADVPAMSLFALAQRGFTHVLGNEVASALTAWRKSEEGIKADQGTIDAWVKARREVKLEQIMSGTLGVRVSRGTGTRVSLIEAIMRSIAIERLRVKLTKFKLKLPTGDKTINVAGKDMGRDALIEAELRHGAAAIRSEAERRMAEDVGAVASADELFA